MVTRVTQGGLTALIAKNSEFYSQISFQNLWKPPTKGFNFYEESRGQGCDLGRLGFNDKAFSHLKPVW